MFKVSDATIHRIEETALPTYPVKQLFPQLTDAMLEAYMPWLAPHHYDPKSGCILLSVHSWLLRVGWRRYGSIPVAAVPSQRSLAR